MVHERGPFGSVSLFEGDSISLEKLEEKALEAGDILSLNPRDIYVLIEKTENVEVAKRLLVDEEGTKKRAYSRYYAEEGDEWLIQLRKGTIEKYMKRLRKLVKPSAVDRGREFFNALLSKVKGD